MIWDFLPFVDSVFIPQAPRRSRYFHSLASFTWKSSNAAFHKGAS